MTNLAGLDPVVLAKIVNFLTIWEVRSTTIGDEVRNEIAKLFLKHVLGAEEQFIDKFAQLRSKDEDKVLWRQMGCLQKVASLPKNPEKFWEEIKSLFPDDYSQEDISLLAEIEKVEQVFFVRMLMGPYWRALGCPKIDPDFISAWKFGLYWRFEAEQRDTMQAGKKHDLWELMVVNLADQE